MAIGGCGERLSPEALSQCNIRVVRCSPQVVAPPDPPRAPGGRTVTPASARTMLCRVPVGRCLGQQIRTAIGTGGPGLQWKKTMLAERNRREGPIKRRKQQLQYGKKMQQGVDLQFRPLEDVEAEAMAQREARRPTNHIGGGELKKLFRVAYERDMPEKFLVDADIGNKIMKVLGQGARLTDKTVVVVGCGAGLLAERAVAAGARRVIGIEKDTRFKLHYTEMAQRLKGVFRFQMGDVLDMDLEEVVGRLGDVQPLASWKDESNVIVLSFLNPETDQPFFLKTMVDLHARAGVYAYGSVPVYSITRQSRGLSLASDPNHAEFSMLTMQRAGFFDAQLQMPIAPRSCFGVPGANTAPDSLVLLTPKATPTKVTPAELMHAAGVLNPRRGGKRRDRDARASGGGAAPAQSLFSQLSHAMPDGRARAVLDHAALDGGIALAHLSNPEVLTLLEAIVEVHPPTTEGTPMRRVQAVDSRRRDRHDWDPLLDTFLDKQATAARW